jgi:hypothetical protein
MGPECRVDARYPLALDLRYRAFDGLPGGTGSGRTIDLGSSGISFTADRPLTVGQNLDISIDWPVPLTGGVRLQLIVWGSVVRADGNTAALRVQRHEFRTRG